MGVFPATQRRRMACVRRGWRPSTSHLFPACVCVCVCTYICMGDGWAHHSSRHGGNITSGNRRDERHQVVGSSSAAFMFMEMFALVNTNRHASTQLVTELHLFCHFSKSFSKKYCIGIFYFYKIDFYILQKMSRNILDTFMQMNMVPFCMNKFLDLNLKNWVLSTAGSSGL